MLLLQVFLFLFWLLVFYYVVSKAPLYRSEVVTPQGIRLFFLLKVAAGIAFTLVYTYYYTDKTRSDVWRYFNDSLVITDLLWEHPGTWLRVITGIGYTEAEHFQWLIHTQNFSHPASDSITDNTFIIRLLSLLNLITAKNIYANTLFFSFLSFTGSISLQRFFEKNMLRSHLIPAVVFLFPSLLFWASGASKDTLVFTVTGCFLYTAISLNNVKRIAVIFVLLAILLQVKVQYLGTFLLFLPLLIFYTNGYSKKWLLLQLGLLIIAGLIGPAFIAQLLERRHLFTQLAHTQQAGSFIEHSFAVNSIGDIVRHAPTLFADVFLRPYWWNWNGLPSFLFGLENQLIWATLLLLTIKNRKSLSIKHWPLALFFLAFGVMNYAITAIAVPIEGALVHYRTLPMTFCLLGISCLFILEKVKYIRQGSFYKKIHHFIFYY